MRRRLVLILMALPFLGLAQHRLTVRVIDRPDTHTEDGIYITGNFNMWAPAEESMRLQRNEDGTYGISVTLHDVPSDRLEFKFTRGDWKTSECTAQGRLVGPRLAKLDTDTTIDCRIEGWRDDFPESTASGNVHTLDSAFSMPQLGLDRHIWIYLPEDYETSGQRYPVIYMHDGQHLFDEATSQGRIGPIEWGVDEFIDESPEKCIVVAINHNPDMNVRVSEYYYHANEDQPDANGTAYLDFIVHTLKPYVDGHYRTLSEKEATAIAGSSMGGLISLYAGIKHPETFGTLGLFSPSIWLDFGHIETELTTLKNIADIHTQRYYFYAGKTENRRKPDGSFVNMYDDVLGTIELLEKEAGPNIELAVHPQGRHGALYWREAFPAFYKWFMENTGKIN